MRGIRLRLSLVHNARSVNCMEKWVGAKEKRSVINGISLTQIIRRHELEYSTPLIQHLSLACVVKSSSPIAAKPNLAPAISLSTPPEKRREREHGSKGKVQKSFFLFTAQPSFLFPFFFSLSPPPPK